ncbi:hypothetical protein [Paraburkholderia caribensis]
MDHSRKDREWIQQKEKKPRAARSGPWQQERQVMQEERVLIDRE